MLYGFDGTIQSGAGGPTMFVNGSPHRPLSPQRSLIGALFLMTCLEIDMV
jgi:hypothetical protein